jgi:hypothetical protein
LQGVQPLRSLTGAKQMLAQTGIESRQVRQYLPGFQQFRRQGVEQFMLQVVEQRRRSPLLVLPGHPLTTIEQGNARAGAPATAALDDLPGRNRCLLWRDMDEQLFDVRLVERQRARSHSYNSSSSNNRASCMTDADASPTTSSTADF